MLAKLSDKRVIAFLATFALLLIAAVLTEPIALYFREDYRPWEESMWDLAETRENTQAVADNRELSAGAPASYGNRNACAAFAKAIEGRNTFFIRAQTYCKIRTRTDCACGGRQWYEKDDRNWLKVHITGGPHKGADVWVCGSAVGPTVTPL